MISFWTIDLEEKIIEKTAKNKKVFQRRSYRNYQTSDTWLQHMNNLRKKMLITNLILDENWMLTTRCKVQVRQKLDVDHSLQSTSPTKLHVDHSLQSTSPTKTGCWPLVAKHKSDENWMLTTRCKAQTLFLCLWAQWASSIFFLKSQRWPFC